MALLASLTTAMALFVLLAALLLPRRPSPIAARLRFGMPRAAAPLPPPRHAPFRERVGKPFLRRFRSLVDRPLPARLATSVERRLQQAGAPMAIFTFLAWQGAMIVLGLGLIGTTLITSPRRTVILLVLFLAALLAAMPLTWLRGRARARQKALLKALPDAVDLIVTTVEAGLSVDAALAEVAQKTAGPLGAELRIAMREIMLGRSRRAALLGFVERAPVPELKSFIHALLQAQESGIPVGQVLRSQADEIRVRKRQRAEAEAGRAPVKMVLVLVFLVMPSMILVMMGPAAIRFLTQMP